MNPVRKTVGLGLLLLCALVPAFFLDAQSLLDEEDFIFEASPLVFEVPDVYTPRSLDEIFPGLLLNEKQLIFGADGLRHSFEKYDTPMLIPDPDSGVNLLSSVMSKNPSHIVEVLVVSPYNDLKLNRLDIYNALGRIENIKNQTVFYGGNDINIFTETTRLKNTVNRKPIPDPPPADTLPDSETMFLRFKDAYFGNLFIRGDLSTSPFGITYSMTNFTTVFYLILPIMGVERFSAIIYFEPVKEGVLAYCVSGFYLPGFIADRVNLTPNINRRIKTLINWITDGMKQQENIVVVQENNRED